MTGEKLTWFSGPSAATEEQIVAVENVIGRRLPDDYREFAKRYSGGSPNETDFEFSEAGKEFFASVGEFFTLLPNHEQNLVAWMQRTEFFPADLVPFAVDGGGNYICFDYRSVVEHTVVFWHCGRRGVDNEVSFVAKSFTDFIELLHEPYDEN